MYFEEELGDVQVSEGGGVSQCRVPVSVLAVDVGSVVA